MSQISGDIDAGAILDAQDDVVAFFNLDGTLGFVNRAFCRRFGGDPNGWSGRSFALEEKPRQRALAEGVEFDSRLTTLHGPRWFSWKCASVKNVNGKFIGWQATGRDVTYLKHELDQFKSAAANAKEAARTKTEFLATITHEIRTPLNGILGMAGLLCDTQLTPEQLTYTAAIRDSGEALLILINDILDYSKIEAGKVSFEELDFNLAHMIQNVSELLAPRAQDKGIEIAYHIEPGTPILLRGDEARLRQVVLNLASNAIKFTEQGGVGIVVSGHTVGVSCDKAELRFDVEDTGIGIPEGKREWIFEKFAQADSSPSRRYEGTGLGLAICRKIVEAMNGTIAVKSREGEGSVFSFVVTLRQQAKWQPMPSARVLFGLKVMVACASPLTRRAVEAQLAGPGITIVGCDSGRAALDLLVTDKGAGVTTLICDIAVGDMTAQDLLTQARAVCPLPAIVLLSPRERGRLDELMAAGFDAYLIKPVRQDSLIERIKRVHGLADTDASLDRDRAAAEAERGEPSMDGPRLRVLLAEDNQINAMLTSALLKRYGHHVDRVANGEEVLAALDRAPYDIVLMDVRMPEVDGLEATRRVRAQEKTSKRLPIIALTANTSDDDKRACLAAGMDDFLIKPLDSAALFQILRRWTNIAPIAKVS